MPAVDCALTTFFTSTDWCRKYKNYSMGGVKIIVKESKLKNLNYLIQWSYVLTLFCYQVAYFYIIIFYCWFIELGQISIRMVLKNMQRLKLIFIISLYVFRNNHLITIIEWQAKVNLNISYYLTAIQIVVRWLFNKLLGFQQ